MKKTFKTNYKKSVNYGKFNQYICDMINHTLNKLGYNNVNMEVSEGKIMLLEDDFTGETYTEISNGIITLDVNIKSTRHNNFIMDNLYIKILNKYGFVINY